MSKKFLYQQAALYAKADASDPFAYNRAVAHIKNGIASVDPERGKLCYTATPQQEERSLPDGTKFTVTTYKNVARP